MKAIAKYKDEKTIELVFDIWENDYYLRKVQDMVSRAFNRSTKTWTCPLLPVVIKQLEEIGFLIDPKIKTFLKTKKKVPKITKKDLGVLEEPRNYQVQGVKFIESKDGRCLLGDDTGIGKTFQAIAWMNYKGTYPTIVVCPSSLKYNWSNEIKRFLGKEAQIISGYVDKDSKFTHDIVIINYELLTDRKIKDKEVKGKKIKGKTYKGWKEKIRKHKFKLLIVDESQNIKNPTAKRSKAVISISKTVPYSIPMSATPFETSPLDLFTTFKLVDDNLFNSYSRYKFRYGNPIHNGFGWQFKGVSNISELRKYVSHIMIRRMKKEVLPELPDSIRQIIPIQLPNIKEYIRAEAEFAKEVSNKSSKITTLHKLEGLKKIINKGKEAAIVDFLENYLGSGNKIVVFGFHTEPLENLNKKFKKQSSLFYGKMSAKQKNETEKRFNDDESLKILLANMKSGGVGLNLVAAPNTLTIELPYNPAWLYQNESRIHRLGQKADKIVQYYLIALNTLEQDIMETLDERTKDSAVLLDGKEASSEELLVDLLVKKIKERQKGKEKC